MAELRQTRTFSIEKVRNLLTSSKEALRDAQAPKEYCSARRRFDAAYDAALCCALALLEANKLTVEGQGHHMEAMQYLVKTLKIKGDLAAVISPAIRMRNTNRYDGSSNINETLVDAMVKWAERIQAETELWFSKNQPLALKP